MQPRDIRVDIHAFFAGKPLAMLLTGDLVSEAAALGRQQDVDLVFVAALQDGLLHCALVVGRSALCGREARDYLMQYFDQDDASVVGWISTAAEDASEQLTADRPFLTALRSDTSTRWRSFSGAGKMKSAEEILGL